MSKLSLALQFAGQYKNPAVEQELRQLVSAMQSWASEGATWQDVPFAAGNFWTPSATWTVQPGNVIAHHYLVTNTLLLLQLHLTVTTLSGAGLGATLNVRLPPGFMVDGIGQHYCGHCAYKDAGVNGHGDVFATPGQSVIQLVRDLAGTVWPASTTMSLGVNAAIRVSQS